MKSVAPSAKSCTEIDYLIAATTPVMQKSPDATYPRHDDLDLDHLIELATFHKVSLLLNKDANGLIPFKTLPEKLQAHYKEKQFSTSIKNLTMASSLLKVLQTFQENNIRALTFKGPVLSQQVYKDINQRPFCDLDILISKKDIAKVCEVLLQLGFDIEQKIDTKQLPQYTEMETYFGFLNKKNGVKIDLQWDFTNKYTVSKIPMEVIQQSFETLELSGKELECLSIEDTLVHHCIHASSHCWEHLESVTTLANLIHNTECLNWPAIIQRAKQFGATNMTLLGVQLCHQLYRIPIHEDIHPLLSGNKKVKKTAVEIEKLYRQNKAEPPKYLLSWRFSLFHIRIRDSFSDQLHYALRLLFRPTVKEWFFFPHLAKHPALYYFIRPLRLISNLKYLFIQPKASSVDKG